MSELRIKRELLGLSRQQVADLTETNVFQIQKLERPEDRKSHVPAPRRYEQLLDAYLAGFRPEHWPEDVS